MFLLSRIPPCFAIILTDSLAYLKHPTDPSTVTDSSESSVATGGNNHSSHAHINANTNSLLAPEPLAVRPPSVVPGMPGVAPNVGLGGAGTFGHPDYMMESTYEVFDPLNWMLDGLVDFPYTYNGLQGLEPAGLGDLGGLS